MMARARTGGIRVALALVAAASSGCAVPGGAALDTRVEPPSQMHRQWVLDPGYYAQAVAGHLALVRAARPVDDWLAAPDTPAALRASLQTAQRLRRFAVDVLHLPDNASYTRYVALDRSAVVWNVVATPPHDLRPHRWCFPVSGCVAYRGYYREEAARAFAQTLPADWDVAVLPVPAYSTLGWTQWLGGDPLLSTFMRHPAGEVARILFHELAHQVVYVPGDSAFSESFATAVERLGLQRWLEQEATPEERRAHERFQLRRQAFRDLLRQTRQDLQTLYTSGQSVPELEAGKQRILDDFRGRYLALRASWGHPRLDDGWILQANNALFALHATYEAHVPAFLALFERVGGDFPRFYQAVRDWARLPADERHRRLREAAESAPAHSSVSTRSM